MIASVKPPYEITPTILKLFATISEKIVAVNWLGVAGKFVENSVSKETMV